MKHVLCCTGHELKIPEIVKSEGLYLYDQQGKRYMDLESGIWCTSLGHNNADINKVIATQTASLMHAGFCYSHKIIEESAQSVLEVADMADGKCVFLCSGSEAIEISRQMAKHLTKKPMSLTLHDSYLGAYSSIADKSRDWALFNWDECKTCPKQQTCDRSCELLRNIPAEVSDFIFEPGSSSGYVHFPPKALINNIIDTVRDQGGTIIVNEVTTGIGRTGKWFGYQHYGICPDFVAVGKGIGNGYPVSIALISGRIAKQLEIEPFHYSQSHQNDPLGAAIALGVIQTIVKDNLLENARNNGLTLLERLTSLVDKDVLTDVRGRGLMIAVDIKNKRVANNIYDNLIEAGYILGYRGSTFRIDPPLTITESEVDKFIHAFAKAVKRENTSSNP